MKSAALVVALCLMGSMSICQAAGWTPKVLIYSSGMPGLAQGLRDLLESRTEAAEFMVLERPSQLSSLLAMPDVSCVVLAVMAGSEIKTLVDPLYQYFQNGGALIGFQGCGDTKQVGILATQVFPVFGNSTGSPVMKEGRPVNEYVRDQSIEGYFDVPRSFDLVGQFFSYSTNATRHQIDPSPALGLKTVLFRESKTNAPLVVAYENPNGSRSVCFAGCFVRSQETEKNYFGRLLEDPNFIQLITDALNWTTQGATRSSRYQSIYQDLIRSESDRVEDLLATAEKSERDRRNQRVLLLSLAWAAGIIAISVLAYFGFVKGGRAPAEDGVP